MPEIPLADLGVRCASRQNMNNVSPIECSYIAGFLDGEGTIGLRTGHSHDLV